MKNLKTPGHGAALVAAAACLLINCSKEPVAPLSEAEGLGELKAMGFAVYPYNGYAFKGGSIEVYGNGLGNVQVRLNGAGISDSTGYLNDNGMVAFQIPANLPGSSVMIRLVFPGGKGVQFPYPVLNDAPPMLATPSRTSRKVGSYSPVTFVPNAWVNTASNDSSLIDPNFPPYECFRVCFDTLSTSGRGALTGPHHYYQANALGQYWDQLQTFQIASFGSTAIFQLGSDVLRGKAYSTPTGTILFLRSDDTGLPVILSAGWLGQFGFPDPSC